MSDSWNITQTAFRREDAGKYETIFALANGHLGIRGTVDDGRSARLKVGHGGGDAA